MIRLICLYACWGILYSLPLHSQLAVWDTDQDGMPNGWEYHRQLDLNNPKDAWADPDQDGICNLFEYYLGTDPQDPSQPVFIPYDGRTSLSSFIKNAPRGVVLQVPEGKYALNFLYEVQDPVPRVMIQGGWNNDFTEHDPCMYTTTFDGDEQGAIFDYFITADNSAALILDGLTLQGGSEGAVKFVSYRSKVQLALSNCRLIGNEASRFDAVVVYEDGPFTIISDCIVVNSLLAGNQGTALKVKQSANHTNLKILQSLITNNQYSANDVGAEIAGYGLHFEPLADSALHLQVANSVIWGNENAAIFYDNPQLHPLDANSQYNIYGFLKSRPDSLILYSTADRFTDPRLLISGTDYHFASNSPALKTGIDIGYPTPSPPDLGPVFCTTTPVNTNSQPGEVPPLRIFPNPVTDALHLELLPSTATNLQLRLFDPLGQVIWQERWSGTAPVARSLPMSYLLPGLYQLWISTDKYSRSYTIVRP